jgi:hypothetical protein
VRKPFFEKKMSGFWLLESVTNFLEFQDIAHVSELNCFYYSKTWDYFLSSINHCQDPIPVHSTSIKWIKKYRLLMEQEWLQIDRNSPDLDLSIIPKLWTLVLSDKIPTTFPLQLNTLMCEGITETIPDNVVPRISFATIVILSRSSIHAYSETVEELSGFNDCINCDGLPNFPNLKRLILWGNYVDNVDRILDKYPKLKFLEICCKDIKFIDALKSFQHTLVFMSSELDNISDFWMLQCNELDLYDCPNIKDFSPVSHIPIVRKKNISLQ